MPAAVVATATAADGDMSLQSVMISDVLMMQELLCLLLVYNVGYGFSCDVACCMLLMQQQHADLPSAGL